jgi:hypothetical protein
LLLHEEPSKVSFCVFEFAYGNDLNHTDDDLDVINGRQEQLEGKVQEQLWAGEGSGQKRCRHMEPAPLFFGLALELFPVPFDAIPVHVLLHVNSDFVNDGIDRTFPLRNCLTFRIRSMAWVRQRQAASPSPS